MSAMSLNFEIYDNTYSPKHVYFYMAEITQLHSKVISHLHLLVFLPSRLYDYRSQVGQVLQRRVKYFVEVLKGKWKK